MMMVLWAASSGSGLLFNINTVALRQAIVPPRLCGRVVSVAQVLAWSAIPLGSLAGAAAINLSGSVTGVYAVGARSGDRHRMGGARAVACPFRPGHYRLGCAPQPATFVIPRMTMVAVPDGGARPARRGGLERRGCGVSPGTIVPVSFDLPTVR